MPLAAVLALTLVIASSAASAQTPPAPRDVTLRAPDGVALSATYYAAAQPGPAVLLLHMCHTTRGSWDPLAPQLAAAGIHALAFDYRGMGESEGARIEEMEPEDARRVAEEMWPGDIDAAYDFLRAQPGVDASRIGAAGASCGVAHAVRLADRHGEVRSLVLLAGSPDPQGIAFLTGAPWLPIFAAAAANDPVDPNAPDTMRWVLALSGNARNRFSGFRDGQHGTDILKARPELGQQIVAWYTDTLITRPADPAAAVTVKSTPVRAFWQKAVSPTGVDEAIQLFHDLRQRRQRVILFTEWQLNQLGYFHLHAGRAQEAIRLFRLNTLVFPTSANTYDSLADAHFANEQYELALRMSERALELLPKDRVSDAFKDAIRESSEARIAKIKERESQ
jgi:dienelactone hydrolase